MQLKEKAMRCTFGKRVVLVSAMLSAVVATSQVAAGQPEPVTAANGATTQPGSSVLDNLEPGQWYEVPNSRLDAVAAPHAKFPWLAGSSGVAGVICCWCGGAFDSQRDQLYVGPGGGHMGYNGNEVYAFSLRDMKWRRLTDPYPVVKGEATDPKTSPSAIHTYDGVEYLPPPVDRYVVVGGWSCPDTYALNPDRPDRWEAYPGHGTGRTGDICGYDPVRQLLWFNTPGTDGMLSQWDPLGHHWTLRATYSMEHMDYNTTGDIDCKRGLFVAAGNHKVYAWPVKPIPGVIAGGKIKTTGDTEILECGSPGFCYAPLCDKFVAWRSGADVYTLDMDTKVWTRHPPAASNKVIPGKPDQWGTFGRFRYVASRNVFVLYNSVSQNVFFYRLTADKPNVITAVKAKLIKAAVDSDIPAAAISVQAIYADGIRKNVTGTARYFSLDPAIARVELQGQGVVTGLAGGTARIRAVYTDPALKRGFADTMSLTVKDIIGDATLDSVKLNYSKLTMVAGDSFQLAADGAYTRGEGHFTRPCTTRADWKSNSPDAVTVAGGLVKAVGKGGPAKITASLGGKSDAAVVTVYDAPAITRINFQVTDASPRAGWKVDNGRAYSDARGFGWLHPGGLGSRDDRVNTNNFLLKSFVGCGEIKDFKVKVPAGWHVVRVAMGDPQYGATPFACWVALGTDKLLYYTGRGNDIATRVVKAGGDGLVFSAIGPLNYIIVAPVGLDMDKHANDGPDQ
jgi:hypothetical protein